jgi:hypothetical protein
MKKTLLLLGIVTIHRVYAQCPAAATLVSIGGTCPNAAELQVTVGGANGGSGANSGNISQINWYQGSTLINTATAPLTYTGVTVAGGNSFGTALNQFFFPNAICGDPNDDVYIADVNNSRIVEWTPGATSGIIVAGGNGAGPAANQFYAPYGLCRDASGNLYIADTYNHRVQKWAPRRCQRYHRRRRQWTGRRGQPIVPAG